MLGEYYLPVYEIVVWVANNYNILWFFDVMPSL